MTEFKTGSVVWRDATSYSQTDKARKPTAWDAKLGVCRVYITHAHLIYRPKWIVTCYELGIETKQMCDMPADNPVLAAIEALKICKETAEDLAKSFQNLNP